MCMEKNCSIEIDPSMAQSTVRYMYHVICSRIEQWLGVTSRNRYCTHIGNRIFADELTECRSFLFPELRADADIYPARIRHNVICS